MWSLLKVSPRQLLFDQVAALTPLSLAAWAINAMLCKERMQFRLPVVQCFFAFVTVATGSIILSGCGTIGELGGEVGDELAR